MVCRVFSLEDALANRRLSWPDHVRPSVGLHACGSLAASDLHLSGNLSLAAINNPGSAWSPEPTLKSRRVEETLAKQSVSCRRLFTSHAFHSAVMDPILASFETRLKSIELKPPSIPYLSNVSGTWIKPEDKPLNARLLGTTPSQNGTLF